MKDILDKSYKIISIYWVSKQFYMYHAVKTLLIVRFFDEMHVLLIKEVRRICTKRMNSSKITMMTCKRNLLNNSHLRRATDASALLLKAICRQRNLRNSLWPKPFIFHENM